MRYKNAIIQRLDYTKNKLENVTKMLENNKISAEDAKNITNDALHVIYEIEDFIEREDQNYATLGKGFNNEGRF